MRRGRPFPTGCGATCGVTAMRTTVSTSITYPGADRRSDGMTKEERTAGRRAGTTSSAGTIRRPSRRRSPLFAAIEHHTYYSCT